MIDNTSLNSNLLPLQYVVVGIAQTAEVYSSMNRVNLPPLSPRQSLFTAAALSCNVGISTTLRAKAQNSDQEGLASSIAIGGMVTRAKIDLHATTPKRMPLHAHSKFMALCAATFSAQHGVIEGLELTGKSAAFVDASLDLLLTVFCVPTMQHIALHKGPVKTLSLKSLFLTTKKGIRWGPNLGLTGLCCILEAQTLYDGGAWGK